MIINDRKSADFAYIFPSIPSNTLKKTRFTVLNSLILFLQEKSKQFILYKKSHN